MNTKTKRNKCLFEKKSIKIFKKKKQLTNIINMNKIIKKRRMCIARRKKSSNSKNGSFMFIKCYYSNNKEIDAGVFHLNIYE